MLSFLEIAILLFCTGILLFLFTLTSYSFRVNVSGEKKQHTAQYGIDYVIVTFHNYFTPPISVQLKQYDRSELRHRNQGGASSPHLPMNEKEKLV